MGLSIRDAEIADANAVLAIYAPSVTDTPITFDYEVPTAGSFEEKITALQKTHAFLVAEADGRIIGFAYGSQYRPKAAYQYSAETTIYMSEDAQGSGHGAALYNALLDRLAKLGFHIAIAGITVPNDASIALHERMGFVRVGTLGEIGRKFDRWHDVELWQLTLTPNS